MNKEDEGEIQNLFMDQRRARNNNDINLAYKLLDDIETELSKFQIKDCLNFYSRHSYEKGFMLNIEGKYGEAAEYFKKSGKYAKKNNDELRGVVGDFREGLTLYLGGLETPEKTSDFFLELQEKQNSWDDVPASDLGLLKGSKFNLLKRISDVSFELESEYFEHWAKRLLDHDYFKADERDLDASYKLIQLQLSARRQMVKNNYDEAVKTFLEFIDIGLGSAFKNQQDSSIVDLAHSTTEEISRDYRDLGRALLKSTFEDKNNLALTVFKRGSKISDNRGNRRFLADIQNDLNALK